MIQAEKTLPGSGAQKPEQNSPSYLLQTKGQTIISTKCREGLYHQHLRKYLEAGQDSLSATQEQSTE